MRAFTKSNRNLLKASDFLLLGGAVCLVAAIYLLRSRSLYGIGFPLDDSWIHQTYARNLALNAEWAFRPGVPSAGSTSPLWTFLLAPGFWLPFPPYLWTYALGALILFALALLCEWSVRRLVESYRPRVPWAGLFIALEWHFGWAALSGMETLLHGLILALALAALMSGSRRYLALGLLTGVSVWVRPDGLTLLAPALLTILFVEETLREKGSALTRFVIGFGLLFSFYLLFNLAVARAPMPNTFYAKQAEYAEIMRSTPAWMILRNVLLQLLVGAGFALLPGVFGWGIKSAREKQWASLFALVWCLGYFALYAARLPMYQHGRYIMPAMPIFFLLGLLAFFRFDAGKMFKRYHWMAQLAWRALLVLLTVAFVFLGADSYARDVAVIESEMVVSAKWAAENLPPQAALAAHDIGALGYFDNHPLIDLAGLVTPDVIPFIRDETRLAQYLDEQGADYLIVFPNVYDSLVQNAAVVFVTDSAITRSFGQTNMTIYRWKRPK